MIFNTYWFICFSVIFFPVYWLLRHPAWRMAWLLGSCAVFHTHFAGPAGVIPIIVLGVVTYGAALSRIRALCIAAITLCVSALCFYKYTLFFTHGVLGLINPALGAKAAAQASGFLPEMPPLAISFFAFEFVHYLIEVYRGKEPIRKIWEFVLFAIYFPSLVAGPIKRYQDFIPNLKSGTNTVTPEDVAVGAQRIAIGLVKKIVIADNLTLMISFYQPQFTTLRVGEAWLLLLAISFRILLDFSGYSDMAIGMSRMMGIKLLENFNYPYLATSLQDFWQRWHISLSSWIRDYVYIPLGGNRYGVLRKLANGLIAFALCGFWHGPNWNFVLWGLWHGVGLAINSSYKIALGPVGRGMAVLFAKVPVLGWVITILYACLGWLLFFYEPAQAWHIALRLFSIN